MLHFFLRSGGGGDPRVPVGGILLWDDNSAVPAGGWEAFTPSFLAGRFLMGSTATEGRVVGSGTGIDLAAGTDSQGTHSGTGFDGYLDGPGGSLTYRPGTSLAGSHSHAVAFSRPYAPQSVRHPMIRKTGAPGPVPTDAGVLAPGALPSAALDEIATYIGRVLRANNTTVTTEAAVDGTGAYSVDTSSAGQHSHMAFGASAKTDGTAVPTFGPRAYDNNLAGEHSHVVSGSVTSINLPVARVAHFKATEETVVPVGTIIPFSGDGGNIKDGWRLCDGADGSMDLRDRYLEIAASGDAGVTAGDGTVVWAGTLASAGAHTHQGADRNNNTVHSASHSDTTGAHTHTLFDLTGEANLVRYLIRFIQFLP